MASLPTDREDVDGDRDKDDRIVCVCVCVPWYVCLCVLQAGGFSSDSSDGFRGFVTNFDSVSYSTLLATAARNHPHS